MCGIVGGVAKRDISAILLEGLKRLEYRGYDSAGIVVMNGERELKRHRATGKVKILEGLLNDTPLYGNTGLAHTRWATHGKPSEVNAHPHYSADQVALVHNGIIENHEDFRGALIEQGYHFLSETDSEVVVHLVHRYLKQGQDFITAVLSVVKQLTGAFAMGFIYAQEPERLIATRHGCPLVVGVGEKEYFVASDTFALLPFTRRFIYLEEGDVVDINKGEITLYDITGKRIERPVHVSELAQDVAEKGPFHHFMLKEIFEQGKAVQATLEGRIVEDHVLEAAFGVEAKKVFEKVRRVKFVACGTSYHAALVARYWLEELGIACQVEVASEFRYRKSVVEPDTLFVTLSQSGETADTLAALRLAKQMNFVGSLAICNVPESSLVRESQLTLMTNAGPEIGVASTKAFTTQLTALLLLCAVLGRRFQQGNAFEKELMAQLKQLPALIQKTLLLEKNIQALAKQFADKQNALFIARGIEFPIALEGALKLKEISYIHAEAYPAGELKHGPLALVDDRMLVVALAPSDQWSDKLKSNLQEVRAREGRLIIFAEENSGWEKEEGVQVITMPKVPVFLAPIVYTVPLQLLAYHVAVLKGTDVDQPRNLAKSVTVE